MGNFEFSHDNQGNIIVFTEEDTHPLSYKNDSDLIDEIYNKIKTDYPEAFQRLCDIYRNIAWNERIMKMKVCQRFAKCNWGNLDNTLPDINGNIWNLEVISCPLRGECKDENIICRPRFASGLSARETEVLNLLATGKTAKNIANDLHISIHTACKHIDNIRRKLNMKGKQLVSFHCAHLNQFEHD